MNDLYYSPEKFGLTKVAEIDDPFASYSFDLLVVWQQDLTGRLFYDIDSGCSCPSPFEGVGLDDLKEITDDTYEEFHDELMKHVTEYGQNLDNESFKADKVLLAAKVAQLLKEKS